MLRYLAELATPVGGTTHHRLRSSSSTYLVVPATRRSTIGDRSFTVAGLRAWNSLPPAVRSSATIQHLQKRPQISPFWTILFIVTICTMFSALVIVYAAYCALQIVRLTLHYMSWLYAF